MASIPSKEEGLSPGSTRARMFSLRIVHLDYYMTAPLPGMDDCYSHFQGRGVLEVPVVRFFGSTTSGQKTCLHVHKAFPYFYVSYDDDLPQEVNEALAYVRRLASAVEKALKIASTMGAKRQHVHSCSLVRGRKYYGYYPNEQLFIKIVLYYPQEISRMSTLLLVTHVHKLQFLLRVEEHTLGPKDMLLPVSNDVVIGLEQSGGIMDHKFQPYEAHIPYLLQILIDYNLYGMGHLHLSSLKFRNPLPRGPSDLTTSMKHVKSEFLRKTTGLAVETQDAESTLLNMAQQTEIDFQKKEVDPRVDPSTEQKKDESASMCPTVKLVSPGSNQSTPVAESQPELWLHGSVPGEWVWPILASSQGQGPYARQSTCALEADTSVEDILNRGELLFKPLQQTGPEVKMVQSLTPIWEEELLRSGEDGPAGTANVQQQLTARTIPPVSSLEQAMRDALFQIANTEAQQVRPTSDWKEDNTPSSDPNTRTARIAGEFTQSQEEVRALATPAIDQISTPMTENNAFTKPHSASAHQTTAASIPAQGNLLQWTQVANGEITLGSSGLNCPPILRGNFQMGTDVSSRVLGSQQLFDEANNSKHASLIEDNDDIAVNEEAIKSHLSQRLQSQDLDNEAAEFLRWLGTTQNVEEDEIHEQKGGEMALSQMFSSPGMDSALLKALADYENATEKECQAILDCVVNNEEDDEHEQARVDVDVNSWREAQFKGDKEAETGSNASSSTTGRPRGTRIPKRKNDFQENSAYIPQTDGACDEEEHLEDEGGHDEPFFPSKRPRVDPKAATALDPTHSAENSRANLPRSSGEESKEVSVRDMMRRRRERRPSRKGMSCSPSSLSEDTRDGADQGSFKESGASVSISEELRTEGRKSKREMDDENVQVFPKVESRRKSESLATSINRPAEKYLEREKKGRSGHTPTERDKLKPFKYAALPLVKVKNESSQVDTHNPDFHERDTENPGRGFIQDTSSAEHPSKTKLLQDVIESSVGQLVNKKLAPDEKFRTGENSGLMSRGDDRDCGGGHGSFTFPFEQLGKERASDGPSGGWSDGTSMVMIPGTVELHPVMVEKDGDFREIEGTEIEHAQSGSIRDNRINMSQSILQLNCREILGSSSRRLDEFSGTGRPVVFDTNATQPSSEILVQATGSAAERNKGFPLKEESGYTKVLDFSWPSGAQDDTGNLEGSDNEVLHPTQYLFTDMSDESQESYDSGSREWVKEHKWDAADLVFEDEGKEEVQRFDVQEPSHLAGLSKDKSTCLPPKNGKDVAFPYEEPFVVHSTPQEPFVAGKTDLACESDMPGPSTRRRCVGGESSLLLSDIRGHTLSYGSVGKPIMSTNMDSPSAVKYTLSIPPLSIAQSTSACKESGRAEASEQDTINFPSFCPTGKEADPQLSIREHVLHAGTNGPVSATQSFLKDYATNIQEGFEHVTRQKTLLEARQSLSQEAPVPSTIADRAEQLFPLFFHQRPPDKEQLLMSCRELASSFSEEGGVYYGNVKDVSDRPTVMAGLIFDVKSKEAAHLRPFAFGGSSKRSNFEQGSRSRQYIEHGGWGAQHEMDSVVGIPSHFENDGTVSYLIRPAKPPPSPLVVRQWVALMQSEQCVENVKEAQNGKEHMFTMDANTGKLVPIVEIGSSKNSQESLARTDSSQEEADYERPASPKYDERHVLNLTHHSSAPTRSFSQKKLDALNLKESSVAVATPQVFPEVHSKSAMIPCTAETSKQHLLPPANISTHEELRKEASRVIPGNNLPQDQLDKQPSVKLVPKLSRQWRDISQITAITPAGRSTPLSQAGFRDPASIGGGQQITLMSIEVFAETRGQLLPDPRYDAIGCIVLVIHEDGGKENSIDLTVVLIRDEEAHSSGRCVDGIKGCETIYLPDEAGLLKCFAQLVHKCDPDMLLGWEIQGFSIGLLAERAANLGISLLKQLSRMLPVGKASPEVFGKETGLEEVADLFDKLPLETKGGDEPIIEDEWGRTHGSGLYVGGRIVLNIWRIMRGEVKLGIYSLEAVAQAVLRRRVPRVPWQTLSRWFFLGPGGGRFRCLEYFIDRARLNLQIMDQLDLMNRTAELARVFGIDFYSVFSRGSQFRVESMMARLAHTQNYILVSPTRQQVSDQPAMECLPLVMEPESRFYTSPVIVLDFQSLYPSMIIAYNLCFSTCLGKLVPDNPKIFGVSKLSMQPGLLDSLKESMTITPNGVMFTPKEVRPGVLPRLLQEILSTRIMVKKAMKKLSPDQRVLQRVLNARQFALKLIANVTYGYTAAGFSGRMPCAEIADSIVQCGRLTLERAIHHVNSHPRWGARVVYGDTDSMFVLLEGRTRDEAHAIGQEIAAAVTEQNPPPVTLKMEKVYHPCVLLTKKRYVGYSYESASQVKPMFDAKGIETIRRDSCPAVAKTLEHSLRTLFESQDLSQVKHYLQRQWGKILSGRVSVQDFIFAKEVRLGTYSSRSPVLPPAAIVASKAMAVDPRAEPRYAERIPYVVVHGEPGARLVDMVVDPLTLIEQPSLRLHDTYYITKQIIPACQRIFMLVGVDLKTWFSEMPRVYRPPVSKRVSTLSVGTRSTKWDPDAGKKKRLGLKHGTIDQYYLSRHCTICGQFTRASQLLCSNCIQYPGAAAILLPGRTSRLERELKHLQAICRHCGGGDGGQKASVACVSLDCSVFFERRKVHRELQAAGAVSSDLGYYPPCLPELF